MIDFAAQFAKALAYDEFLQTYGSEEHRRRWTEFRDRVSLSSAQQELVKSFRRQMNVLCLAGAWCGDCVNQCPILAAFAAINPRIALRFADRDAAPELAAELKICGGARVPVAVFLSEDFQEVARFGDRTLAKYRRMAADQLGAACPTGLVPSAPELVQAVVQDWLDIFERAELILRTSPRLREKHSD
jgi:hypothetical protein